MIKLSGRGREARAKYEAGIRERIAEAQKTALPVEEQAARIAEGIAEMRARIEAQGGKPSFTLTANVALFEYLVRPDYVRPVALLDVPLFVDDNLLPGRNSITLNVEELEFTGNEPTDRTA